MLRIMLSAEKRSSTTRRAARPMWRALSGSSKQTENTRGRGVVILARNDISGASLFDDFGRSAHRGGHAGEAACHGFQQRVGHPFAAGGLAKHVAQFQQRPDFSFSILPRKRTLRSRPSSADQRLQCAIAIRFLHRAHDQEHRAGMYAANFRGRPQQHVEAFHAADVAHRYDQRPRVFQAQVVDASRP